MTIFLVLLVLASAAFGGRLWINRRTRARLLASALSDREREIVEEAVPLIRRLPPELRKALDGKMALFRHQVRFIGCNGLEVTEEMELAIAAQACVLVVNTDAWYQTLRTILIYPGAFKSRRAERDGYVVTERETVRDGESWARGPVILSWKAAEQGASDDRDGHNVVFHEFAHQIDDASGRADGVPLLNKDQTFAEWARVFVDAFDRLKTNITHGHQSVIDPYGATGHEEFFAVSVEVFFERPHALKAEEPEVYDQLARLFRLDPGSWSQHAP